MKTVFDPPDCLSPNDRLTWYVGRISQADVHLELGLRSLHAFLKRRSGKLDKGPVVFVPLLKACKTGVDKSGASDRLRAAAEATFEDVEAAHEERNRMVHDMWLQDPEQSSDSSDPEQWVRVKLWRKPSEPPVGNPSKTLKDLNDCLTELARAAVRLHGLYFALTDSSLQSSTSYADLDLEDSLATAEGAFRLLPDGGYRIVHSGQGQG